jgi:hypothetical protein
MQVHFIYIYSCILGKAVLYYATLAMAVNMSNDEK